MPVELKKILLSVAVMCLCTLVIVSVIQRRQATQGIPANAIRIGVPMSLLSSPFLLGEELKLFEQHDLNVTLIPCSGGVACTDLMIERNVDYAVASESVIMFQSFEHDDISLLASFVESDNDLKLLTLEPSNIGHIQGLSGKKIGVVQGTSSEFYLDSLLISHNLQDMPIEKVYVHHHELIASLLSFNVDVISAWEPMGYQANLLAGPKVNNLGSKGVYQLSLNLISRSAYLAFAEDEPVRLLQAIDEAIQWINRHPEKAQRLMASKLDMPINQIEWSWEDYVFRLSLGNSLLSNMQLQARWAIENNLVTTPAPDFRKLFYRQPYQQVVVQRD